MPLALRAHAVWKSYAAGVAGCSARVWVLRGASLHVDEGERVAILGARGAGTTTLLQCLAGLRRMDAGTVEHRRQPLLVDASAPDLQDATPRSGDIVLLDSVAHSHEPTPIPRVVRERAACGVTTIIGTHELSTVRHLVDRVLLLRDGHLTSLPLRSGSRRVAERSLAQTVHVRSASPETEPSDAGRQPSTVNRSLAQRHPFR